MRIESILSGVLSGGSSLPLHRMAARLRPPEESQGINKLPESDCQNCQSEAIAETESRSVFSVVDTVELSPVALSEVRIGADPEVLKRRSETPTATTYDAFGRAVSDDAYAEAQAQDQPASNASQSESAAREASEQDSASSGVRSYEELSEEEQQQVDELKARDTEVRQHEQAHLAAAGQYAQGGPTFEYQTGPDGNKYAIGGEVQIDTSPIEGDPEATIQKMQTVIAAALAPGEPSGQDRSVASQARAALAAARAELAELQGAAFGGEGEEGSESTASLSAAVGLNPAESAAAKSDGSNSSGPKSKNDPQLYNAQGATAPSNDERQLARELDLVA